jgi:adenylate kinase
VKRFKRVILVTGTPGVGKTSVSALLASKLKATHIELTELVEHEGLISGLDEARGTLIADMNRVSKRMQEILRDCKRDVIVDGHYAVHVTPEKDVHLVFVLRRDPEELKKWMKDHGFKERKLWENLAAEILDVCLWEAVKAYGPNKVCEINVNGRGIDEVAEDIISVLEQREKCRVGIVDWLGKLEAEGQLHNFLKDF